MRGIQDHGKSKRRSTSGAVRSTQLRKRPNAQGLNLRFLRGKRGTDRRVGRIIRRMLKQKQANNRKELRKGTVLRKVAGKSVKKGRKDSKKPGVLVRTGVKANILSTKGVGGGGLAETREKGSRTMVGHGGQNKIVARASRSQKPEHVGGAERKKRHSAPKKKKLE